MYLLDTMVLSALRQRQRNPNLVAWLQSNGEQELFLSVITIGEVEKGIVAVTARDPEFAQRLVAWLDEVLRRFAARILPIDTSVARRWGCLAAAHGHGGADLLDRQSTRARARGLTMGISNRRHFKDTGVALVDPLADPSGTA